MASNAVIQVDTEKLWVALSYHMFMTDKHSNEVAAKLGFHPNVITKLKRSAAGAIGYQPSAGVLLALCWWMGKDPRAFQTPERPEVLADPVIRATAPIERAGT